MKKEVVTWIAYVFITFGLPFSFFFASALKHTSGTSWATHIVTRLNYTKCPAG